MNGFKVRNNRTKYRFIRFDSIVGIISIIVSGIISIYALETTVKNQEKLTEKTIQKESLELLASRLYEYGKFFNDDVVAIEMERNNNIFSYTKMVSNKNTYKDPIETLDAIESTLASSFLPEEFTKKIEIYINNERENEHLDNAINECIAKIKKVAPDIYSKAIKNENTTNKSEYIDDLISILKNRKSEKEQGYKRYKEIKEYVNKYAINGEIETAENQDFNNLNGGFQLITDPNIIHYIELAQCTKVYSDIADK